MELRFREPYRELESIYYRESGAFDIIGMVLA